MIKISIIIPYYKTYELTEKLLKSLEVQLTDEVEVILIDDGCYETRLDQFKKIKIFHIDHINEPSARNVAIKKAIGRYIAFVDSDDMVMPDYVEQLINIVNTYDEDVIKFNWIDINRNMLIRNPKNIGIWKAIYKREICPLFNEEWTYRSDVPFDRELKKLNPTIAFVDRILYIYNSGRIGSLTWEHRQMVRNKFKKEVE